MNLQTIPGIVCGYVKLWLMLAAVLIALALLLQQFGVRVPLVNGDRTGLIYLAALLAWVGR